LHLSGETLFTVDVCLFSAIAQPAPAEAVMVTDRRGEIRHVNPAFTAVTGYSSADVAGLTPAFLKSGAHDPATFRKLWDTILDGRVYRGALVNRLKNGELYHEHKVIRPVLDANGRPVLFLSSGRDVTTSAGELETLLGGCTAMAAL
jgi:PAS domain S-box-containing protein